MNIIISLPSSTLLNLVMFTSCLIEEQSSADSLSKTFKVNSNKMKLKVRNNNPPFLALLTLAWKYFIGTMFAWLHLSTIIDWNHKGWPFWKHFDIFWKSYEKGISQEMWLQKIFKVKWKPWRVDFYFDWVDFYHKPRTF